MPRGRRHDVVRCGTSNASRASRTIAQDRIRFFRERREVCRIALPGRPAPIGANEKRNWRAASRSDPALQTTEPTAGLRLWRASPSCASACSWPSSTSRSWRPRCRRSRRARDRPDQMSWVQTAYLIAEVIAIPLTGLLTRALSMRWLFVRDRAVHHRLDRLRASAEFSVLIVWRLHPGLLRRHPDPGGVRRGLPAVSRAAAGARHDDRRRAGGARRRPSGRSSAAGSPRPFPGTGSF